MFDDIIRIYATGSEIWGRPLHQKIWRPKTSMHIIHIIAISINAHHWALWPNFGQLRNLMANISGMKQDIVERKTALQTSISTAHGYLIW